MIAPKTLITPVMASIERIGTNVASTARDEAFLVGEGEALDPEVELLELELELPAVVGEVLDGVAAAAPGAVIEAKLGGVAKDITYLYILFAIKKKEPTAVRF